MAQRSDLQDLLETFGAAGVYFQPPPGVQMEYPAIVYRRNDIYSEAADNFPYVKIRRYSVTLIDRDPDSTIINKISALPRCTYDRFFVAGNLNHDVFNLYY